MQRQRIPTRGRKSRAISPEYLAGFIDAEGSLMLAKVKRLAHWSPGYAARVYVDNTNKAILEDIQRGFGGILTDQPAREPGWKHGYKLVWSGRRVDRLLSLIEPYLQVKRSRARILLQFIGHKRRTKQGHVGRSFARLSPWVLTYRETLYRRMRELNARGPRLVMA